MARLHNCKLKMLNFQHRPQGSLFNKYIQKCQICSAKKHMAEVPLGPWRYIYTNLCWTLMWWDVEFYPALWLKCLGCQDPWPHPRGQVSWPRGILPLVCGSLMPQEEAPRKRSFPTGPCWGTIQHWLRSGNPHRNRWWCNPVGHIKHIFIVKRKKHTPGIKHIN